MFSAFLIASFILAVTPGPGVLYIVTRSLTQGRRFGLASVVGVALGNQAIRAPRIGEATAAPAPASLGRIFRDGFVVALLNPKTAVFFAAFLPQFMNAQTPAIVQSVTLGSIFVAIAALTDTAYALAAGALAPALVRARGVRAAGRYVTGGAFVGLAVYTVARD